MRKYCFKNLDDCSGYIEVLSVYCRVFEFEKRDDAALNDQFYNITNNTISGFWFELWCIKNKFLTNA